MLISIAIVIQWCLTIV